MKTCILVKPHPTDKGMELVATHGDKVLFWPDHIVAYAAAPKIGFSNGCVIEFHSKEDAAYRTGITVDKLLPASVN